MEQLLSGALECVRAAGYRVYDPPTEGDEKYVEAAKKSQVEGELEVDDNAVVSRGEDPGAYVLAWVWVADEELETQEDSPVGEEGDYFGI